MLKNCVPAPCAALLQYCVLPCQYAHTSAALVRIRPLRWHVMLHATTSGWIMDDAVLVCIRKMSARAYTSSALRLQTMLHIIHYPTSITSASCHKPSIPLPFYWNKFTLALSRSRCKPVEHCQVNVPVGRPITFTGAGRNYLRQNSYAY